MAESIRIKRKTFTKLYENNRRKVYFFAACLLNDKSESDKATYAAFKNCFKEIEKGNITSEDQFNRQLNEKVVEYAKAAVLKKDAKAFRVIENQDFHVKSNTKTSNKDEFALLKRLPVLNRFVFVLGHIKEYRKEEIASLLNLNIEQVNAIQEAEKDNIAILSSVTMEEGLAHLKKLENTISIPTSLTSQIYAVIEEISAPIEKETRKRNIVISIVAILVIGVVLAVLLTSKKEEVAVETEPEVTEVTEEKEEIEEEIEETVEENTSILEEDVTYIANIDIDGYGTIVIELDPENAPISVENFINLAESGFYDGLTFHRIINGFMMQGGDPKHNGTGGSGESITGEFSANGIENNRSHVRGTVSMARSSSYDSATSQFFICQADCTSLDGQYAAFGFVTEGMEIVDKICEEANPTDNNGTITFEEQPVIHSITIERK